VFAHLPAPRILIGRPDAAMPGLEPVDEQNGLRSRN